MGKHKTGIVWAVLVLLAIGLLFNFAQFALELLNAAAIFERQTAAYTIVQWLLTAAGILISLTYFVKLYNVSPDVVRWTHITFGYTLVSSIALFVLAVITNPLNMLFILIIAAWWVIIGLVWLGLAKHLKKARANNTMDFS